MAMCRQTVQRYGGFPIPAIFVRDAGEALSGGYTRQPSRLHGLCKHKKRHFGAAREENLFLSRGKYIFLGRKKIHPLWMPVRLHGLHGYTGYVAFVYYPPEMSTSFYK